MFVVAVVLVIYFWRAAPAFLTKDNIVNISQITAPVAIIAIGEVFLLVCGEIDLSVGFVFAFSPFLMHYLIDFYGVPAVLAVLLSLLMGVGRGLRQRVHHGGAPGAVVHRHARHRVHPLGADADHLECLPGEHPEQGTRHRALDRHVRLGRDHLGHRPGGDLPGGAQPHPLGPAHGRGRAATSSERPRPASTWPRSNTAPSCSPDSWGRWSGCRRRSAPTRSTRAAAATRRCSTRSRARSSAARRSPAGRAPSSVRSSARSCSRRLTDGFNLIGISANPLNIIFGAAILVAMIANVQLARLRRAGRTT